MAAVEDEVQEPAVEPVEAPVEPAEPAEAQEPQEEPAEPQEPVHEPAEPVVDEAQMEKFYKSLGTRTTTFNNWLSAELGEGANDLQPCPLCADGIMGHIYPVGWVEPTSDLQARLFEVIKTPIAPEYWPAPNVRKCGTCDGWGKVASGSRVAGKTLVLCPQCRGNGFQGDALMPAAENGAAPVVELVQPEPDGPVADGDHDIWGSPRLLDDGQENPNYGKMVQYKDPSLP